MSKQVLFYKVVSNQSLSADFTSPATVIKFQDNCSYQIKITTTNSVGTFTIQASDDYLVNQPGTQVENPGTWTDLILGGGTPFANAANDTIIIDMNQVPFAALRMKYTSSVAGTGTCDILFAAKQIGGS